MPLRKHAFALMMAVLPLLAQADRSGSQPAQSPVVKAVVPASTAIPPASSEVLPADAPLWRFAYPNSGMLFSVRLPALLDSPVLSELWKLFGGMVPGNVGLERARRELAGVDLMMLSLRVGANGRREAMMLVRGDRPQTLVRGQTHMRYLDPKTILVGEWNAIHAAIQRVITPGAVTAREERVKGLSSWSDLWLTVDHSFMNMVPVPGMTAGPAAGMYRQLSMAMTTGDIMTTEVCIDTPSVAAANKVLAELLKNPTTRTAVGDVTVMTDFKQEVVGTSVRLSGKTDVKTLSELVKQKAPPQPPKRNTVVIQGMEGGTKEIPVRNQ